MFSHSQNGSLGRKSLIQLHCNFSCRLVTEDFPHNQWGNYQCTQGLNISDVFEWIKFFFSLSGPNEGLLDSPFFHSSRHSACAQSNACKTEHQAHAQTRKKPLRLLPPASEKSPIGHVMWFIILLQNRGQLQRAAKHKYLLSMKITNWHVIIFRRSKHQLNTTSNMQQMEKLGW